MIIEKQGLWPENANLPDSYAAFRGSFDIDNEQTLRFDYLCSHWCRIWADGQLITQGPPRYNRQYPEYDTFELRLARGRHTIAAIVTYPAKPTRMLEDIAPFWFCRCRALPISWKCLPLDGFERCVRRINPQLGWIEWCDTRKIPAGWNKTDFNDGDWQNPQAVVPQTGDFRALSSGSVKTIKHRLTALEQGEFVNIFLYPKDDPPTRFFLRPLSSLSCPPSGIWRRYDLGRVRLGSPMFRIDVPQGTVIEFAYSEYLTDGRVAPYINGSTGLSANMDIYTATGGLQEFAPITPKGGRFLEVHIFAEAGKAVFEEESFLERAYYEAPEGSFTCPDALLNKIWQAGIETFRACTEDAVTDNPTRERGQWTGDVVSVGMETAAAGFSDMRLFKRALMQAAQSRKSNGLVAGMSPGASIYVSSFAAQWISACVRYYEITGDKNILLDNRQYACDNMEVFEKALTPNGLSRQIDWAFIDWGYLIDSHEPDTAMDCHYLWALRSMRKWADFLGDKTAAQKYANIEEKLYAIIDANLEKALINGWHGLGYHSAVLAGMLGFFDGSKLSQCVEYVKSHILNCFPENPSAPRLSDPAVKNRQLITPYFSHFAFDFLINNGQMDFVLQRYRNCWGWALEQGLTTIPEVFDLRWSHCHQWSACPTWQMSRYCLGIKHRFDKGRNHFEFVLNPGSLCSASGVVPLAEGGKIQISWKRDNGKILYSLHSSAPISISGLPHSCEKEKISDLKIEINLTQ